MSKFSKILGVLVMFTLLLTACGGGQQTQTQPPATQEPTEVMTEAPTEVATEMPATEAPTEAPTEAATQAPVSGEIDCMGAQQGDEISMLYQWAGAEEAA